MNIQRINTYRDLRFSQGALNQHGCFLVDGEPYEVEIISRHEAIILGREDALFPAVIGEFRFYAPHITVFYNGNGKTVLEYPPVRLLTLSLKDIQPSQFFVDAEKISAVKTFLNTGTDIIIQVMKYGDRYISLDGHTRLRYAVSMGWDQVLAVEAESDGYIYGFVEEAQRRQVFSPYDLQVIPHEEYEIKWNRFCDEYFSSQNSQPSV